VNLAQVKEIANAVLYEGYLLYPYRHSAIKNRQRWTIGVVYPREYSEANGGTEPWVMRTECLVEGQADTTLDVWFRFLHLLRRQVVRPGAEAAAEPGGDRWSAAARVAGEVWEEGTEREVPALALPLGELAAQPRRVAIDFPAARLVEPLDGTPDAEIVREQQAAVGAATVTAEPVGPAAPGVFRLSVQIENTTPLVGATLDRHDLVLPRAFVSTHTILQVHGGAFVSLMDPPPALREAASACRNQRAWPVLVGDEGDREALLASPIILYDYPKIAPESPGALFDGTEIDEILTLRIMTLTDDEKAEVRQGDARAREVLERTEALTAEQLWKLHGVIRDLRPADGKGS
jgi:hypothetical protein